MYKIPSLVSNDQNEIKKIYEEIYLGYTLKSLLISKKFDQKIEALNNINQILTSIKYKNLCYNYNKTIIEKMTFKDFCVNCKKKKILQTLFSDQSLHEEITKRLPEIIFTMYKYNFGYVNKGDEDKIKSEKITIFNALFNKLIESEQNNEKLVKSIQDIICDFCDILSEEDKLYVYEEIKKYLEKSIEKKGIPVKEHLLFVIDYTVKAIKAKSNNDKKEKNKKNEEESKEEAKEEKKEEIKEENINQENNQKQEITEKNDNKNDEASEDKKYKKIKLNDDNYYGLNLLLDYLLEEQYKKYSMTNEQKIELINISIKGIIKIIENCEQNELLLEDILFRAISAIKNSKDVLQFLILFEKIKKNNKDLNSKFSKILYDNSKKISLLSELMSDMSRYLSLLKNNSDDTKEDRDKEGKKVYEGLFNNELNIKLRLELILILLQKNLNEENLNNFKTQIMNSCQNNNFANECLSIYIYNNLKKFDIKFIQFFYDNILLSNEKLSNVNDYQYYKLCKAIIEEINKMNKLFYFMNNKDLAVRNCESEKDIKGIDLLWNFLIKTKNDQIRNNVTNFLANIFFGIRLENEEKLKNYWKHYVKSIYDNLDEIIQSENENNNEDAKNQSIQGIISLIKKIENKFTSKGEIIDSINNIIEEINLNKVEQIDKLGNNQSNEEEEKNQNEDMEKVEDFKTICFSGYVYNTEKLLNYDLKIDRTEYFYAFRYKLSSFFKIPVNLVKVVVDESKYDKSLKEQLEKIDFDLYNDFDNTYSKINNIEQIINKDKTISDKENPIILKVKAVKENPKLKYIKQLIKDLPKLIKLLKRKKSGYLLDIWCLIKEDNIKINEDIIKSIKESINENNANVDSIFNFEETNIYYISYILFHLNSVINELNEKNDKFINNIFLTNKIWQEKIKNLKIESDPKPHLGEIYEKNNIINYLLNIYKKITLKTNDKDILIFILKKIFDYYYQTIIECVSINLKELPSTDGVYADQIEDLYISNTTHIKDIIIKNNIIYNNLIKCLLQTNKEDENNIKTQFEFLFREGLIKNRRFTLNEKMKSFLLTIIDDSCFNKGINKQENLVISDFYLYLLNFFLNEEAYEKAIDCIKEISLNKKVEISKNVEKYEKNIELYFDIIISIINKVYSKINNKFNFKHYINEIILQKIYNPIIDGIPLNLSYHEIVLGGHFHILNILLSKSNDYKDILDLKENEEKKLKDYLFHEIIMNKCNNNIFTESNINNYRVISINSFYTFKGAVNLLMFIIMANIRNEKEEEINYFFDKLTDLHKQCYWKGDSMSNWKLDFKDNNKLSPFVGLKNLGCTCYMNSLLQVFFHFIPFRESLLKCKCKEEKKNSLYQIKKVFYCLKYLQVSYYVPTDFPNNYDDEVLNVHSQMDIDEFFGNILDKIENRLKNTKNENLVKYFFQGRQNDVLTFQEGCTHHRNNSNSFYSIQLQVQNKKNLYESLDALTEGELMNGDNCIFCPDCNKKLPAVKSQNFKTLPRMLIFVLKRFEFNYNTMTKLKINDYYEFPTELDMSKYISEKKEDEELNKYSLKSVVVHMGNSEGGHYYAFIKNKNEEWYEFNDTQVKPFDINFLGEEAFGGEEIFNNNGTKQKSQKNRSAYLLFYEKKVQTDCEQFDNIEAINSFLGITTTDEEGDIINNDNNKNNSNVDNSETTDKNSNENRENKTINEKENKDNENIINDENQNEYGMKDILKNINKEMFKYFLNKKLFSNEYQYFILELYINVLNYYYCFDLPIFLLHLSRNLTSQEITSNVQTLNSNLNLYLTKNKLVLFSKKKQSDNKIKQNKKQIFNIFKNFIIYFFNVFLRTKDKEYLGSFVDLIKLLINDNLECANYLIEEFCNRNVIVEYLINCPLYDIKKLIVGILYCAMIQLVNQYKDIKIEEDKINQKETKFIESQSTIDDEKLARQLSENLNGNESFVYQNPLEYEKIPTNLLKFVYNILHIIRDIKYRNMNESRFLYFIIYRFSLISFNTREFLINKCRLYELLCLLLHKSYATYEYDTRAIVESTYIGPYTVTHGILNSEVNKNIIVNDDKVGNYRIENYIYMLFFNLLSYTPNGCSKNVIKMDSGYFLDNRNFVRVLLNNIRTKQDAFCFSNYINEKCKNNKNMTISVFECLIEYLNKIDNNENTNYDYNNYLCFVNNNMNENPNDNDPGMNPKYLLYILKRFISIQNIKNDYIQKGIKIIFTFFWKYDKYYNYCIMIVDFLIELFSVYLMGNAYIFKKELIQLTQWLEKNPISPSLYHIDGILLYKYEKKNYDNNISEEKCKEFDLKEIEKTRKRIEKINCIIKNEQIEHNENYIKELDLSDYKFMIGEIILYDGKEVIIEEALDELLKLTIDTSKKNGKKGDKKTIWVETDDPKIEIKESKWKHFN